jgi:hypothetical protein
MCLNVLLCPNKGAWPVLEDRKPHTPEETHYPASGLCERAWWHLHSYPLEQSNAEGERGRQNSYLLSFKILTSDHTGNIFMPNTLTRR